MEEKHIKEELEDVQEELSELDKAIERTPGQELEPPDDEDVDIVDVKEKSWKKVRDSIIEFINKFAEHDDIDYVQDLAQDTERLDHGHYICIGAVHQIKWKYGSKSLTHTFTDPKPIFYNLKKSRLEIPVTINNTGLVD